MGVLLLVLGGVLFSGVGACFLGLGLSLHLFLSSFKGLGDIGSLVLTAVFVFICPIISWITGAILDSFSLLDVKGKVFRDGLLLGSMAVFTLSDKALEYLGSFCILMQNYSSGKALLGITSLITSIIFVSFAIAITIITLILIFEIATHWFIGATRSSAWISFSGLRPILVVVGISLSINLIIGLFASELWPVSMFGQILGK